MFGGASGYTYTLTRQSNGLTDVDVVIVRDGKGLRGRVFSPASWWTRWKALVVKAFAASVKAIEPEAAHARRNSVKKANTMPTPRSCS